LVALAEGVGSDRVIRHLVGRDFTVHEAACHEETLEDFYLSLMKPAAGRPRTA
jgi:hypothetical protein